MSLKLFGLTLLAVASLEAATITNPSFETPALGNGNYQYNPGGATWTFTGLSGITANASAWGFLNAPDGTQVAFLQVAGSSSSFSETITNVNAGDVISFYEAQRPGYGINSFDVLYNGATLGSFTPGSTSWTQVSVTIPNGAPSSGVLLFQSTGALGADRGTGIDNLTVASASAPEPGTFALASLALSSLILRKRPVGARR